MMNVLGRGQHRARLAAALRTDAARHRRRRPPRSPAPANGHGGAVSSPGRSTQSPAKNLSGGNQQKVVLAKWLLAGPAIVILDEPTRGIDVGAKLEIYPIIDGLAAEGCGMLLISSEIEEPMAMCDRILVMSRGEIVGDSRANRFDKEAHPADRFSRRAAV